MAAKPTFPRFAVPAFVATFAGIGLDLMGNILPQWWPDAPHYVWTILLVISLTMISAFPLWICWALARWLWGVPDAHPQLKCYFSAKEPGCVVRDVPLRTATTRASTISSPWTSSVSVVYEADFSDAGISEEAIYDPPASASATYYRLKTEAIDVNQLSGCYGQLVSIRRGAVELLPGEAVKLPFAPADKPDSEAKRIISGTPEFLDFLMVTEKGSAIIPTKGFRAHSSIRWGALFAEPGDYVFMIRVTSAEGVQTTVKPILKWAGKESPLEITCP